MVTIRNATYQNVIAAVEATSRRFDNNIEANRFEQIGRNFFVTLKVKNSHGNGARRGYTGRAMIAACWHVYGIFFDELIKDNPAIVIVAMGKKIGAGYGNWYDSDVGSIARPRKYSEMCECGSVDHGMENTGYKKRILVDRMQVNL